MSRRGPGDAFEVGVFLPARQVISFPDVLTGYVNGDASASHVHPFPDPQWHLLEEEADRLDRERMAAEIARYHAARREASMLAMVNIALPLGHSVKLTDGQNYLLGVARDERDRLGRPEVTDLSRAGAAMRGLICHKLGALVADSVRVAADGDTLVDGVGTGIAVLGELCPKCWYATRAALAQREIDDSADAVLGQGLLDTASVAILYALALIEF